MAAATKEARQNTDINSYCISFFEHYNFGYNI